MGKKLTVALLGYGTVGYGFYELASQSNAIDIKYVLDRVIHPELGEKSITDYNIALNDAEVQLVVELIGGLSPAYEYVKAALESKKSVVTANKAMLQEYYEELYSLAKANNVTISASATCGGGIPWLPNLQRLKRITHVKEISGIFNGTTNFILDSMTHHSYSFESVLKDAQDLGYAEADPSSDIDGYDTKRKIILSANLAYNALIRDVQVPVEGIRNITSEDVAGFHAEGYVCKLVARAKLTEGGALWAVVEPTLYKEDTLEANVPANYNLITVISDKVGKQSFFGEGAGRYPTAGAVYQDVLDLLENRNAFMPDTMNTIESNNLEYPRRYYVRYQVDTWFMDGVVEKRWGNGVITRPVTPAEIHSWYLEAKQNDPTLFFAAIED